MMRWSIIIITALVIAAPAAAQQSPLPGCFKIDDETRDKVRALVLDALDEALKEHVKHMFVIWMRDEGQPARTRASHGTRLGIRAYLSARTTVLNADWICR